jgi:hypothetical protein
MARELPPVVMIRWLLRFSRWRLFQMPSTSYSKRVKAMLYFCTLRSRSFSNRAEFRNLASFVALRPRELV